jgi:hypothetical protein
MRLLVLALMAGLGLSLIVAPPAGAESLGTFRWQMLPFCNVLAANITRESADSFSITGWDNKCGGPSRDGIYGAFFFNPRGDIGGGLTIVSAGGAALHLDIVIDPFTLSGTWTASDGTSGSFVPAP